MRILWGRVFTTLLAVGVVAVFIAYAEPIIGFLKTMPEIGPSHSPEQQTIGLIAFALVLVGILALARILTQGKE